MFLNKVTASVLLMTLSLGSLAGAVERTVFKAQSVFASKVVDGWTYKSDPVYAALKTTAGSLSFNKDSDPGVTFIAVDVSIFNPQGELPFILAGVSVPNKLMEFKEGTHYEKVTYDNSYITADGPLPNGKITVKVSKGIVTVFQVRSEDMGYEISIHNKPAATHRLNVDKITIKLNENRQPVSVEAQEYSALGSSDGQEYTGEKSGSKMSLKF